jgi:hypothetical protein
MIGLPSPAETLASWLPVSLKQDVCAHLSRVASLSEARLVLPAHLSRIPHCQRHDLFSLPICPVLSHCLRHVLSSRSDIGAVGSNITEGRMSLQVYLVFGLFGVENLGRPHCPPPPQWF